MKFSSELPGRQDKKEHWLKRYDSKLIRADDYFLFLVLNSGKYFLHHFYLSRKNVPIELLEKLQHTLISPISTHP